MATLRMLPHSVVIGNYIGEVNDVATFQYTTIRHVYCPTDDGSSTTKTGKIPADGAALYIFDGNSVATDDNGNVRTYLPYELWRMLADKTPFWTLYDGGKDTFRKIGLQKVFKVSSYTRKDAGSKRMHHFKVIGK